MTASSQEDQRAGQAVAAGMALSDSTTAHAEQMQSTIAGSQVDTSDCQREIPIVSWFGADNHPGPGPSPQPTHSPNVSDPLDNSQSQP